MEQKPTKVPKLKKGETIYTVEGFVKFWNWLAWLMSKQEIDTSSPEKPKIVARYV